MTKALLLEFSLRKLGVSVVYFLNDPLTTETQRRLKNF
jgi:hypothetical protein